MANRSVYSQNIVTAATVGIYGIYNEINISIVLFISSLSVVLTMFCWVVNHVSKVYQSLISCIVLSVFHFRMLNLVFFFDRCMCGLMI